MTPTVNTGPAPQFWRTARLRREGWSAGRIAAAVRAGSLSRIRTGAYCLPGEDPRCVAAAAGRARLTCVSEMRRRGVFVRDRSALHVHVVGSASRLPAVAPGARVHRTRLHRQPHPDAMSVDPFDALLDAVRCQDPRAAIATIDSAVHLMVVHTDDLDELFAALPRRYRRLRGLVDARAESGPETLMRLMARGLGCRVEVQVQITGVGRVDLLIDGWLIVECDSRAFHSTWEAQLEDRRRDLAAAALGFCILRFVAEDIMWRPEAVLAALRGMVFSARSARKAG